MAGQWNRFSLPSGRHSLFGTNTSRPEVPESWEWKTKVLKGVYDV